ncbi:MAG: osmotically inducible protein OsmC [Desulfocurvibacter africanus]
MALTIEYERLSDSKSLFRVGAKSLPELVIDYAALSDEERDQEHMGARLLCTAALACYTNTFLNALKRKGAEVKNLKATATTSKEKDEVLRTKYSTLDVRLDVWMDEKHRGAFEAVRENMLNGSLLTYSLEEAMAVDYELVMHPA